jgi:transcriptional regulator with XRE-family HTH domain
MVEFGELLEKHRVASGLSKARLASAANLSGAYVGSLINGVKGANGEKKVPSIETVEALATALGLEGEQREEFRRVARPGEPSFSMLGDVSRPVRRRGRKTSMIRNAGIDPNVAGITGVHITRPNGIVERYFWESRHCIRIQDTWVADPRRFTAAFLQATNNGVTVQVLLLDPESPYARQRSLDLQLKSELGVSDEIRETITQCGHLRRDGVDVEVRLYSSLPSIPQIICDEHMFVGFFLHGERSDFISQLEIEGSDTELYKIFEQDFSRTWDSAGSVNLEDPNA